MRGGCSRRGDRPPRLYRVPSLRCAEVSGELVLLDLSTGIYEVVDEVGTGMWPQLLLEPDARDLTSLADSYGVDPADVEDDLAAFGAAQSSAGRLTPHPGPVSGRPGLLLRRRPTLARAVRERASAQRDLGRGFADAYTARTSGATDTAEPRTAVERLLSVFRTADGIVPSRQAPLDCLPRSLALTRFLRISGWPAEHVIGVALHPFEAHAWVRLDGQALGESPAALRRYVPIAEAG